VVFVTHDVDEAVLLGEQIAVMTTGAHVEQFATPAELLARPANTFVADFLGNDRGLKLLSLVPASDVGMADVSELVNGWQLVTDPDRRPVGWTNGDGAAPVPVVGVGPNGTARSLLDAAVSAPSGYAVRVDDDGRVVGVVSYGAIGRLLTDKLKAASA
ncbi:MAG TPA: hypothetical protein VGF22_10325, partial [Acidimicrobiales bacterium]